MVEQPRLTYTYRQDDDEQKVDVCNVVELQPQVFGQETDGRIFCRPDLIALVLYQRVSFAILGFWW